ncbi:hypothetical protein CVS40_6692 [Lucilia cuprina]|nr:hypothetical protein CVS40_6692 [Lucilia cuprina]
MCFTVSARVLLIRHFVGNICIRYDIQNAKIKEDYDPKIHTKVIYRECLKVTQNVNVGKQRKCIQLPTTYLPMNSHTHISTYLQTNIPLNKKTDTPFAGNCLLLQVNTTIFHNFYEKQVRNYICGLNPNSRGE